MKINFTLFLFFSVLAFSTAQIADIEVPVRQRSLVMKHTATWCPPCGRDAWDTFKNLNDDFSGEAVFLQVHISRSSLFFSPNAKDLLNNCDRSIYQPEFFFNTFFVGSGSGNTESYMTERLLGFDRNDPAAQTGIAFFYSPEERSIRVDTKTRFFKASEGEFFLSVFLVIKDTVGFQEARSFDEHHQHVLHSALTENTFGEKLNDADPKEGEEFAYSVTAALPDDLSIDQVEIVTVLWKGQRDGYEVVNTNLQQERSELITTSRREIAELHAGFKIAPTVVISEADILLDLPRAYDQVELVLFNLLGQPVQSIYRGALGAGTQRLGFQRNSRLSPGIYLIRLKAGEGIVTRRVIFR